jgi:excinuclease ABC subunit A
MAGKIVIHGARVHNLKNIDVEIPRERLVVVTGVSGSGKSSLAFDTIYAEGQRRYLESLSANARQLLQQMERPDVESIEGLSPAIAIQPKTGIFSPRSTVGTLTEIYDYLRLLYARAGQPTCIQCGRPVVAHTTEQIVDEVLSLPGPRRIVILAPIKPDGRDARERLAELAHAGFTRVMIDREVEQLSEDVYAKASQAGAIGLIIDRLVVRDGVQKRLADSIEIASRHGDGVVKIEVAPEESSEPLEMIFSQTLSCVRCAISIPEIEPRLFSFNNAYGACPACGGMGFISKAGGGGGGADAEAATEFCSECHGNRLRPESLTVKLGGKSIAEVASLTAKDALIFFSELELAGKEAKVGKNVLDEITCRLRFLAEVGLDYLTLNRSSRSLSGGEAQRVRLATQVGSNLAGVLYILDEPSIGLHQSDNTRLIALLKQLRDRGNSVILVEHDPETILEADYIIDMGPGAGVHGGEIVAYGTPTEIMRRIDSLTGQYLSGRAQIAVPAQRRKGSGSLIVTGAREHNLKNVTAAFPVGALTCVTGVSGAGKSSLVMDILYPALAARLHHASGKIGRFDELRGWEHFDRLIAVDQSPIGRTPRSNPATYTGIYDDIRSLFAQLPEARVRGYKPARFSFNASGGRCEACRGDGVLRVDMYFLPDVSVTCDVCKGRRYNRETLEIKYKGLSIADVLALTVNQAAELLNHFPSIHERLLTLREVGLGYLRLGQAASTLSGGEAQRVKLARELARRSSGRSLYILDEPTTGLHFEDVKKLLDLLNRLTDLGNTVIVIEHNLDVIKTADYVIDLGPGPGAQGGEVVAQGTPEQVASVPGSLTGHYLRTRLAREA